MTTVLAVEDEDSKYLEIEAVLKKLSKTITLHRAKTVRDADAALDKNLPELLLLDISMNISSGSLGPLRGGYANLGGMDVAERLYLFGRSVPTVLITAFDYFPSAGHRAASSEMLSLANIEKRARVIFGADYLGCVRYAKDGWQEMLIKNVSGVLA